MLRANPTREHQEYKGIRKGPRVKTMKCCVRSIMIHLVEADGKGEWWHQMNSHDFSGASSACSKETHLLKDLRKAWVSSPGCPVPVITTPQPPSLRVIQFPPPSPLGSPSWIPYCLLPSFPCPRAPGPAADLGDQNKVVMTSSAS